MLRTSLVVALVVLFAGTASAAPVACDEPGGYVDVTALSDGCYLGPLVFADFAVSSNAGVGIGISDGSAMVGDSANLLFTVNPANGPSDTTLIYSVTGGTFGVDMALGTFTGNVTIIENVCTVNPTLLSNCAAQLGTPLASFAVDQNTTFDAALFDPPGTYGEVWVRKDISIEEGGRLSDFINSHETPEPTTLLLMGTGLFALGLVKRRASKRG